ncbi:FAD-dependent oxidoreductase [Pseudonocardia sp. RS010]|uniref:FAD-dependent oxidoreductase n=1 Tax=Pseudonocardia sp. RS010 TaxID=3385979 RepID=UPI0039A06B84
MESVDVVVVGAGPVGLWLAAELRTAGVNVVVLEQRTERDPNSKALTIHPRTIEVLDSRGMAEAALSEGMRVPTGHFAVLDSRLGFTALDTPYPFTLALPQARTEELFEEHARRLGADVRRGRRVEVLDIHPDGVTVRCAEGGVVEAGWVVGCDGVHSTVRRAAGIAFPGPRRRVWVGSPTSNCGNGPIRRSLVSGRMKVNSSVCRYPAGCTG